MNRSLAVATGVLLASLSLGASGAMAQTATSEGAAWQLEQPAPPPPPSGVAPAPAPIGLGPIGDIKFWAPNRGLLITAGNDVVAPGVWSYDGVSWHQLSTVCGGTEGRIAWAGPNDFWTISDSRPGQVFPNGHAVLASQLEDTSLCHFQNGAIVASYATPIQTPTSYLTMDAASCVSASDCWFGGDRLATRDGSEVGAFHLHWDGQSLTEIDGPQGRSVAAMATYGGRLIESVAPQRDDVAPGEVSSGPQLLHRILPFGSSAQPFVAFPTGGLPTYDYGAPTDDPGAAPTALGGLRLSANDSALWAAAGPLPTTPTGTVAQPLTVLEDVNGRWHELAGHDVDPQSGSPFAGDGLADIAAEPGADAAWLTLRPATGFGVIPSASLVRLSGAGTMTDQLTLPGTGDGVGPKGAADTIVCPAARDCWMATTEGWLFHLTDGTALPQDSSFAFTTFLASRPTDGSIPPQIPDNPPVDDSGLPAFVPALPNDAPVPPPAPRRRSVALVTHLRKGKLVHGTTLVLSFHLTVKSRVRLRALRKKRVVAQTRVVVLSGGNRKISLRLNRKRWPTRLDLQIKALVPVPTVPVTAGGDSPTTTAVPTASVPTAGDAIAARQAERRP